MQNLHKQYSTVATPQSQPIPGSSQVANNAGGFAFPVDDWTRAERFLILGTEGGSYYCREQEMTRKSAEAIERCIKADPKRLVNLIVDISDKGRAYKNDPALFALAMVCSLASPEGKTYAYAALPKVARIGTHLFHFAEYRKAFGGEGSGWKRAVSRWYTQQKADNLAYQVAKYQSRDGWSHWDLLRVAHPKPPTKQHSAIFRWLLERNLDADHIGKLDKNKSRLKFSKDDTPRILTAFEELQGMTDAKKAAAFIKKEGLPRECVPTQLLNSPVIWEALFEDMPMTAMIRNLATMTKVGLLKPMSSFAGEAVKRITDEKALKKARIHPIQVLVALNTYAAGHGMRSQATWEPIQKIVDALDEAFYLSFENVEPTGKRILLALDVSGSMSSGDVCGVPGMSPRVASSAMAMVTARTEQNYHVMAFSRGFVPVSISPKMRLDDICQKTDGMPFDRTDCALPMLWASKNKVEVDAFVVYTDSETWAGNIHPTQALNQYRKQFQIPAKLIVCGMVANEFSIADPNDNGMLDVVGFDASAPKVMENFIRG